MSNLRFLVAVALLLLCTGCGPDAQLLRQIRDPDVNVKEAALAPKAGALLKHEDAAIRQRAAQALAEMGPAAASQTPELAKHVAAPALWEKNIAEIAAGLGADDIGTSDEVLEEMHRETDTNVRLAAIAALGAMGEAEASQAPIIGAVLKDSDAQIRAEAARALGQIGEAAAPQASELAQLVWGRARFVATSALSVLCTMGDPGVREFKTVLAGTPAPAPPALRCCRSL